MKKIIGVITGDIVASRDIPIKEREKLYLDIKNFLEEIKQQNWIQQYELFRGDSFQCVVSDTTETLRVALILRTFVKSFSNAKHSDIRLGIGIGAIDFLKKKSLAHSDGEAFHFSGDALDKLKNALYRILLKTANTNFNESLEPSILLLDALMQKWTSNQAEIILYKLQNIKEDEIAALVNISQSAVNQRAKTSQWYAVEKLLHYFYKTLNTYK